MNELVYQNKLIKKLQNIFEGCYILKNDPQSNQGIPDILMLWEDTWAMFEVKKSGNAHVQPNQRHYVNLFNEMSFCAFIYPENEDEVLHELQQALGIRR